MNEIIDKLEAGDGIYLGFSAGNTSYWPGFVCATSAREDMRLEFRIAEDELEGVRVLLASYNSLDGKNVYAEELRAVLDWLDGAPSRSLSAIGVKDE